MQPAFSDTDAASDMASRRSEFWAADHAWSACEFLILDSAAVDLPSAPSGLLADLDLRRHVDFMQAFRYCLSSACSAGGVTPDEIEMHLKHDWALLWICRSTVYENRRQRSAASCYSFFSMRVCAFDSGPPLLCFACISASRSGFPLLIVACGCCLVAAFRFSFFFVLSCVWCWFGSGFPL